MDIPIFFRLFSASTVKCERSLSQNCLKCYLVGVLSSHVVQVLCTTMENRGVKKTKFDLAGGVVFIHRIPIEPPRLALGHKQGRSVKNLTSKVILIAFLNFQRNVFLIFMCCH